MPALAARIDLTSGRDDAKQGFWHDIGRKLNAFGGRLRGYYSRGLHRCLGRPWLTLGTSVIVAVAAGLLFTTLENELVPDEDRGSVGVRAQGPDGVGLDFMDRELDEVEAVLQPLVDEGLITSTLSIVGRYDPNRVQVEAELVPWEDRDVSQTEVVQQLREPLSRIPGSRASASGRGTLSFGGSGNDSVEVALTGAEYEGIYQSARALAEAIDRDSDILSNPDISYQPTQPQISIQIDRRSAADVGVDFADLSLTLRAMVGGFEVVDLNVGDQSIPIFLTSETVSITNPEDLRNLYVRGRDGQLVPLSSVTTIVEQGIAAELDRTEQRRAIEVEAAIAPGVTLAEAVAEMERLAEDTIADDIDLILQGEAQSLEETGNDLLMTYLFAIVIVLLVLVAQFESITSALVVMLTVPFALAAAVFALFISGTSLNIYSQIGLVMLIGLMAKNGILIVEFADQLRQEGRDLREAVEEAATIRLRPIAMTLISTVVGALPLILASGAGAEARQSIGWVIFGGLGIAAVFTLFLTPVLYMGIARFGKPRSVDLQRVREEIEGADEAAALSAA